MGAIEECAALLENPGVADGGAPDEDAVDAIAAAGVEDLLRRGQVAVAEDGYVEARVGLGFGFWCVHVC